MVTLGVMLALASRSTMGKIAAMWLPIVTFFALGFEHSIVNMFVIPAGKLFGAPISLSEWWLWNQLPVTLGNLASGALLTGLALYFTYQPKRAEVAGLEDSQGALGEGSIEPVSSAM
jgi:formate/nitrite transporter FocA (FNT family)